MPGAAFAEPCAAGFGLIFRGNRGKHALDAGVGFARAADHDRRAVAGAFLTAGNAHADEGEAAAGQLGEAPHRVAEIGISGIDDDVAVGEHRLQQRDLLVDGLAGLHQKDDRTRRPDGIGEFGDAVARDDPLLERAGAFARRRRSAPACG